MVVACDDFGSLPDQSRDGDPPCSKKGCRRQLDKPMGSHTGTPTFRRFPALGRKSMIRALFPSKPNKRDGRQTGFSAATTEQDMCLLAKTKGERGLGTPASGRERQTLGRWRETSKQTNRAISSGASTRKLQKRLWNSLDPLGAVTNPNPHHLPLIHSAKSYTKLRGRTTAQSASSSTERISLHFA